VRTHVNRLIAMALVGLWHGAAGHFVLWGLFHGVGLNVHRAYRALRARLPLPADYGLAGRIVATFLTFHFVCLGWVFFVADAATASRVVVRLLGFA
jgi:D-alanyl-lipoteichoic acid acyltransferase DltB (MBOAT superfamily)